MAPGPLFKVDHGSEPTSLYLSIVALFPPVPNLSKNPKPCVTIISLPPKLADAIVVGAAPEWIIRLSKCEMQLFSHFESAEDRVARNRRWLVAGDGTLISISPPSLVILSQRPALSTHDLLPFC